jgi:hypothetical protein
MRAGMRLLQLGIEEPTVASVAQENPNSAAALAAHSASL